ncbi:MAG: putative quinol monooxygenase [Pseudomonadota bacterium]
MAYLTITGNILAKSAHLDTVKSELRKLVSMTRQEQGCIQYDLHQDNDNPNYFMFYENWETRELWQAHMENSHIQAYLKATEGMIEKFWLHELTRIE